MYHASILQGHSLIPILMLSSRAISASSFLSAVLNSHGYFKISKC